MKHFNLFVLFVLLLVGCGAEETAVPPTQPPPAQLPPLPTITPLPAEEWAELEDVDALFEQIYASWMHRNPDLANAYGVQAHFAVPIDTLTDLSLAQAEANYRADEATYEQLLALDRDALSPQQQISLDVMLWMLQDNLQAEPFHDHSYTLTHLFGTPQGFVDLMTSNHPLTNKEEALAYIARLQAVDEQFAQLAEGWQRQADAGLLPPAFAFDRLDGYLQQVTRHEPENSIFYTYFVQTLATLPELTEADRQQLEAEALTAVRDTVLPAYEALAQTLDTLRPQALAGLGALDRPNGAEFYAYALRQHTTTDLTADEIHELGLQEVERIQEEIEALMDSANIRTVGQMYQQAGGIQINSEASQQEVIAAYREALEKVDVVLADAFTLKPDSPLEILPVPAEIEANSPSAYYLSPPLDGTRGGVFYVNLANGRFVSNADIATLAIHEGVPGHHYQRALQRELANVPTFRRTAGVTAFAEGWALYAEWLAWEQGFYEDDVYGDFGRLQAELFRAVRLVVDTGIHHKGWSKNQAIDYMSQTLGWPRNAVTGEVERYIMWPGQATSYKIGQLTILRLRQQVEAELGEAFDLAEFHTLLLQNGDVPLSVLETIVNNYIEQKK